VAIQAPASSAGPGIDILIIDDNPDNVVLLEMILGDYGLRLATGSSCADALHLTREHLPGLVLLDVMMSDGDGFSVCRQLKADRVTADTPVIFITALDSSEHEAEGFAAGGVDYILKPFTEATVVARVKTHLELRRHRDHLEQQVELRTRNLNDALRELARASRAKDEFLAMVSHELRTPLNGLTGSISLLTDTHLNSEQRELLASSTQSVSNLNQIVENVLLVTEANAGGLKLIERPFSLRSTLRFMLNEVEREIFMKGLLLDFDIDATVQDIFVGDPIHLMRAVGHILSNAVKFTPNGAVSLRVSAAASQIDDKRQRVVFKVSDTGVGIALDLQSKLFSLFTIGDPALNRRHGGLGVGLALTSALLKLMDGDIQFDSQPSGGSIFTIAVPLQMAPAGTQLPSDAALSKMPVDRTVLIVEDNSINLLIQRTMVEKLGLHVITATNGREALDTLAQQHADLILMDCQMPVMDGLEATRQIRSSPDSLRDIPIIAVTANATSLDRDRCFDVGMSDYLPKPVNPRHLEAKIAKWLMRGAAPLSKCQ
jgi:CheY-like chemotaxis protein